MYIPCKYVYCTHIAGLTMTDEGRCGDHVVVGTKAGDCLFLDAEHDGQVMLCFPAHRSAHPSCSSTCYIPAVLYSHQCVTLLLRESAKSSEGCFSMHTYHWGQVCCSMHS